MVGSTTTMSCPLAAGAVLVKEMEASEAFGAATTSSTTLLCVPSGFCICTETDPATATSLALTGARHSVVELHVVARALPAIHTAEPTPEPVGTMPLPSICSVNPCAAPAYTLAG